MSTSTEPGRSTASRLFAVLNVFDRTRTTMTLTELSAAADLPIATTYRVVRELVIAGALERNDDSTYQIGLRLWEIGALAPRQRDLRRVARPVMEHLHEATGEVVQLAVRDGMRAFCVEKISGPRSAANVTEIALSLPLHATGVGKVILGFADTLSDADVVPAKLARFTEFTIVDTDALEQDLRRVRRELVGYSREELTRGTSSVASPVFDAEGRVVAALGLLTSASNSLARLAPAVRIAALTISQRLGHRAESSVSSRHA